MRFITSLVCLIFLLTGCAGNSQPVSGERNLVTEAMGVPIREASAYGFVTQVSLEKRIITIKHAPIPEMNWAPMVMPFNVADDVDLSPFKQKDKVEFILDIDKNDKYRIRRISLKIDH